MGFRFYRANTHTHIHTYRDKVIAISALTTQNVQICHFSALYHVTLYAVQVTGVIFLKVPKYFYRATLCVHTSHRPVVFLSVRHIHCIETAEDIIKLFLRLVAPSFQFFLNSIRRYTIPRRTPSARALNTLKYEIFAISGQ